MRNISQSSRKEEVMNSVQKTEQNCERQLRWQGEPTLSMRLWTEWVCQQTKYALLVGWKSKLTDYKITTYWAGYSVAHYFTATYHRTFFFVDKNGRTVSVNSMQCEEILKIFFLEWKRRWVILKWTWFQQDEVTLHTTNLVIKCLKQNVGDCLITRHAVFLWPPWGLDPTPCNFFL